MQQTARDMIKELAEHMARLLVDNQSQLRVTVLEGQQSLVVEIGAAPEDVAKIIGKKGHNIGAVRTILQSAGIKLGKKVTVEVLG
jgi:predicted RNA-binding protein YlqC (UPF0109 family)